jgi:hypothetical protein
MVWSVTKAGDFQVLQCVGNALSHIILEKHSDIQTLNLTIYSILFYYILIIITVLFLVSIKC